MVCTIATVVYTCMYSPFRVSSPIPILHTAITQGIILLELWGVSIANCDWKPPQVQSVNHMSGCSAQCANGTSPKALKPSVYSMYVHGAHL